MDKTVLIEKPEWAKSTIIVKRPSWLVKVSQRPGTLTGLMASLIISTGMPISRAILIAAKAS
jgi:hypothetical protein